MNDEKRKNARLQGRFSEDHRPSRKEKKRLSDTQLEAKEKNKESRARQSAESPGLEFDTNADKSFKLLEERVIPVEINTPGEHILSETENGKSRILFEPEFISKDRADILMTILKDATPWYDKNIIIHGQEVPQPRLVAWYGPLPYEYSGAVFEPAEMTPVIADIRDQVEKFLKEKNIDVTLNSVLLNLYRNEKDSVAWHSDDELSLGCCPTIASVSFGAVRKFQMKMKSFMRDKAKNTSSFDYFVNLTPGSLVVMDGCMQKDWKHQVPKEYHDKTPRINLTFRTAYSADKLNPPTSQVPLETPKTVNTPVCKEENKPIFDNSNFPPLNETSSQNKNNSEDPHNSLSDSKSVEKKGDVVSYYSNQNSASNTSVGEKASSDTGIQEVSENESLDSHFATSENENKLVVSASQTEKVSFNSQVPNTNSVNEQEGYSNDSNSTSDALNNDIVTNTPVSSQQNGREVDSRLNAAAVEFVPKSFPNESSTEAAEFVQRSFSNESSQPEVKFHKLEILDLLDLFDNNKVSKSQLSEYSEAVFDYIDENEEYFSERDFHELNVFREISDGSQTERNLRIILKRLCSLVRYRIRNDGGYYRHQPNRTVHRDSNNRPWRGNSYRGSNYRGRRNYND